MHVTDSKGNIVAIQSSNDKSNLNVVKATNSLRIKTIDVRKHPFMYLIVRNPNNTQEQRHVPMRLLIEDGEMDNGDYVYEVVW